MGCRFALWSTVVLFSFIMFFLSLPKCLGLAPCLLLCGSTSAGCFRPCRSWLGSGLSPADMWWVSSMGTSAMKVLKESTTNPIPIWSLWLQKETIFFPSKGKISLLLEQGRKLSVDLCLGSIYLQLWDYVGIMYIYYVGVLGTCLSYGCDNSRKLWMCSYR